MIPRGCHAWLFAALVLSASAAESRPLQLNDWVETSLVPTVRQSLSSHARFKGQTMRFVVLEDDVPAALSNALAIGLRDRLVDAAIASGGIRVASSAGGTSPGQRIDCARDDADYLVGVEVKRGVGAAATVVVRALDVHEGSWVSGFAIDWRGELSRAEQRAISTPLADDNLRGARDAPFAAHETDLLAAELARDIACQLSGATAADYVVSVAAPNDSADEALWQQTLAIAGRHVASHLAIEFAADGQAATATLRGTAHPIGNGLYQYWLTVEPADSDQGLDTLSASAYVRHSAGQPTTAATVAATPVHAAHVSQAASSPAVLPIPGAQGNGVLGPLSVTRGASGSVLRTAVRSDVIVFFVQYQPGLGMMRLGDRDCRSRTIARIAREGESLAYPIADRRAASGTTVEAPEWRVQPERNTYFAIAISGARLARRLADHVKLLPMRCGTTLPAGLKGDDLNYWLDDFAELVDDGRRHVAWRAIEVRDVL